VDFAFSEENDALYAATRTDLERLCAHEEAKHSEGGLRAIWKGFAEARLTGLPAPVESGGRGLGAVDTARVLEAVGRFSPDFGYAFSLAAHLFTAVVPLWRAGTDEQRRRFLVPLATGGMIGGNATTEESNGSNISAVATSATRVRGGYLLDGEKWFSTNAPVADLLVVYASTDPHAGFTAVTAFLVPMDAPGIEVEEIGARIGLNSSPLGRIRFDRCFVPEHHRLGTEGAGTTLFAESMRWERGCLFALYLGSLSAQLERAIHFVRSRKHADRPISQYQLVSSRIVDMRLRLDVARLLLYRAAWLLDSGKTCDLEIALSKLYTSEAAVESSLDAIQVLGGRGCLEQYQMARDLQDAIPGRIFSGTSEIQRVLAARCMGL